MLKDIIWDIINISNMPKLTNQINILFFIINLKFDILAVFLLSYIEISNSCNFFNYLIILIN